MATKRSLHLLLPLLGSACTSAVPVLESRPARPAPPSGGTEALVWRSADPVSVVPAGAEGARPLFHYDKSLRVGRGSWLLVGPGGLATVAFADGSFVSASGECALEILGPGEGGPGEGGGEGEPSGVLFRTSSARRLTVGLKGESRAGLPGGALAEGDGAKFVTRSVEGGPVKGGKVRVESRGPVPIRIRVGGETVVLDGARSIDLPSGGIPGKTGP
ncbi:MAG: hypothetical protein L0323_06745 [Planctomycetes bacterium]|nr:hypothetical protein [Planctomycetota bacterium]